MANNPGGLITSSHGWKGTNCTISNVWLSQNSFTAKGKTTLTKGKIMSRISPAFVEPH